MQQASQEGRMCHGIMSRSTKLTDKIVKYIRKKYKPHNKVYGCRALARKFKVSINNMQCIIHNKTWKGI